MRLADAEDLWLACVCQAPTYANHSLVTPDHLSRRGQLILEEIQRVHAEGWPMVTPDQIKHGDLRTIPKRMEQVDAATTIPQAERALLDAWATNTYATALREAADVCMEQSREAAELHLAKQLQVIQASTSGLHWREPADVAREVLDQIRKRLSGTATDALGSGMAAVDKACRGYGPSRQTTIGGWPGQGKSTLALQLCTGLAIRGTPTAVISLEDEEQIMVKRQLAMVTEEIAAVQRLANDEATIPDVDLFATITETDLQGMPLRLLYMPGASVEQVCHAIQDAARRFGARIVAVDYLQCFSTKHNRREELGNAARALKAAAAQVGVHLILLSQLYRPEGANARKTTPAMYMFKETGDIENLTEYALLVHRPTKGDDVAVERAKIIVDKAKDGPPGVIDLGWDTVRNVFTVESPDEAATGQREIGGERQPYNPD